MPYLGRGLDKGNYLKLDDITSGFNGITTTFNLKAGGSAHYPGSGYSILVSLGGVIQEGESAYTINQDEITFAAAPASVDDCFIVSLGVPLGVGVPGNSSVDGTKLSKPFNYDDYFYFDSTNNRVGIGSLTPQYDFDIVSTDTSSTRIRSSSNTGVQDSLLLQSNGGTGIRFQPNFTPANKYNFRVAANTKVNNGLEITPSNNVGNTDFDHTVIGITTNQVAIGTVTPNATLDIHGANSNAMLRLTESAYTNTNKYTKIYEYAGNTYFNTRNDSSAGSFIFRGETASTTPEFLRITSDGSVGINSSAPKSKLDVKGNAIIGHRQVTGNPATTVGIATILGHHVNSNADYAQLYFQNSPSSGGAVNGSTASIRGGRTGDNYGTNLSFWTNATGSVGNGLERLNISSVGDIAIGGCDVNTFSNYQTLTIGGARAVTGVGIDLERSDGNIYGRLFADANGLQIGAPASGDYIRFETQATERLRITSAGNIGIGNTASFPIYEGDNDRNFILGTGSDDAAIQIHSGSDKYGGVYFGDTTSGGDRYRGYVEFKHGTNDDYLRFGTGGTENIRIDKDGLLLVGHTDSLDQNAKIQSFTTSTDTFAGFKYGASAAPNIIRLGKSRHGTIGSNTIVVKHDEIGRLLFSGNDGAQFRDAAYISGFVDGDPSTGTDMPGRLSFWTSADGTCVPEERLRIASDGNVGIGTTVPGYKLHVHGSFAATTKSFVIPHPTKESYNLRYACLEGPENSVYVRGRTTEPVIELPDYWTGLVDEESITVNLTPIGNKKVWVEGINNNKVSIGSNDSIDCFYTVFAERTDVEKLEVEVEVN